MYLWQSNLYTIYKPEHSIIEILSLKTEFSVEKILVTNFPLFNTQFTMSPKIPSQFIWLNFILDPKHNEFFPYKKIKKREKAVSYPINCLILAIKKTVQLRMFKSEISSLWIWNPKCVNYIWRNFPLFNAVRKMSAKFSFSVRMIKFRVWRKTLEFFL